MSGSYPRINAERRRRRRCRGDARARGLGGARSVDRKRQCGAERQAAKRVSWHARLFHFSDARLRVRANAGSGTKKPLPGDARGSAIQSSGIAGEPVIGLGGARCASVRANTRENRARRRAEAISPSKQSIGVTARRARAGRAARFRAPGAHKKSEMLRAGRSMSAAFRPSLDDLRAAIRTEGSRRASLKARARSRWPSDRAFRLALENPSASMKPSARGPRHPNRRTEAPHRHRRPALRRVHTPRSFRARPLDGLGKAMRADACSSKQLRFLPAPRPVARASRPSGG
jgi:hypothetical protein